MLSTSLIVVIVALVLLIVSFVLAIVSARVADPLLWAVWAIGVFWIVGALAGR